MVPSVERSIRRARVGVAALIVLGVMALAVPAEASWSSTNCHGSSTSVSTWKRSQARSYAAPMAREGYEWDGGCYKLNDRDDTPGAPDSGGEGNDCSGFVFRVWALRADGAAGFRWYPYEMFIHGPYTTGHFYAPASSYQFKLISKTYTATMYMDAFVYRNSTNTAGHIGLIYTEGSNGQDAIIEAKGDAEGTWIAQEAYRQSSVYKAVARKGWTPECYPQCSATAPSPPVARVMPR
jgi:hypothetical protein